MNFLIIASYPVSILKFCGALVQALQDKDFEIYVVASKFNSYPKKPVSLLVLGYAVHDIKVKYEQT